MDAGEFATVFLETSLGTHLAVSFPAGATTVADLRRQVSDEHATAFPDIGQITVQSFKVRRRGSFYNLTDSMVVRSAFHGIKGTWYLQADAVPHSAPARRDAKCATDIDMHDMIGCTENMQSLRQDAACQAGVANLALEANTPSMNQEDKIDDRDVDVSCPKLLAHASTSSLAPDAVATSSSKCSSAGSHGQFDGGCVMTGENSDLHVASDKDGTVEGQQIDDPRGKKHFREEEENHEDLDAYCDGAIDCFRQDDENNGRLQNNKRFHHNSKSKRICGRPDGFLNVNSSDRGDVAARSSEDKRSQDEGTLEYSQNQEEGPNFLEKKEEATSTKSADEVESSVEPCKNETNSVNVIESDAENPALLSPFNENDTTSVTEKHADEGILQETLVVQQDHLKNGAEGRNSLLSNESALSAKACFSEGPRNFSSIGSSAIHSESLSDCQREGSPRIFDLEACKKSKYDIVIDQAADHNHVCSEVEVDSTEGASGEKQDKKRCGTVSATQLTTAGTVGGLAGPLAPDSELSRKKSDCTEQNDQGIDPAPHDLDDCARRLGVKPSYGQKEPWIAQVFNSESSKKLTEHPAGLDAMKEGNSSEKEKVQYKGEEKEPWTTGLCIGKSSNKGTDLPPYDEPTKELNSSKKKEMSLEEEQKKIRVPLDDLTEKSTPSRHGPFNLPDTFKTPTSNNLDELKNAQAISTDNTEHVAFSQRSRERVVVRKVPISRAMSMYGYR